MDNNILFISVFNYGCLEIAENHILSLRKCGIENYMAYVTDTQTYDIFTIKGYNVTYYPVDTLTKKMDFATNEFNELSYIRYKIIGELLNQNKTVWYLDVDTVVLYDLNKLVLPFLGRDIVMQSDINMPCTGCMLIFPNDKTKQIVEIMYKLKNTNNNDQIIFRVIYESNKNIIDLSLFDIYHFPNGLLFFNELSENGYYRQLQIEFKQLQKPIYFVHANWMVGIDKKIEALKSKNLWYL